MNTQLKAALAAMLLLAWTSSVTTAASVGVGVPVTGRDWKCPSCYK